MKKRLLSLLLTVCMTVTLLACLGPTAKAVDDKTAGYLVTYTLKAGETLIGVCNKRNIDFAANEELIRKVNGIVNYNFMYPGTVLWLPSDTPSASEPYYTLLSHTLVAGETPAALCKSYGIDYTASYNLLSALNNNMTTFMAGQDFILPVYVVPGGEAGETTDTGDRLRYYLVQRVLKTGETVLGICAEMGVDFATYDNMIRRLNNITNYNAMYAGQLLLIPCPTTPTSGAYYKVMEHTVVSGDTVNSLCEKYKLDFGAYINMILILNGRQDMTIMYPGEKILMPRPEGGAGLGTVTGTETGTGTGTGTGTETGTGTGTETGTGTGGGAAGTDVTTPGVMDIPSADKVSYLLIPHTLKAGETVAGVCKAKGIDFDTYAARIAQLNGIANYSYMFPGTVVLLPTTVFPDSGPYYKIMAHTIVAGDTVYDLCIRYGLKYDSNAAFIQRLNNRDNMQSYYVGETIYMPIYVAG